jgi:transcriptional regulator with XRE-family HTH domain
VSFAAFMVPPPVTGLASDWPRIVRTLGVQLRVIRTALDWSQEDVARRAAVSQGAVSRMESGHCASTPLVSYLKVWSIVLGALGPIEGQLGADIRAMVAMLRTAAPALAQRSADVFAEPRFGAVLAAYRAGDAVERDRLLRIMEAVLRL